MTRFQPCFSLAFLLAASLMFLVACGSPPSIDEGSRVDHDRLFTMNPIVAVVGDTVPIDIRYYREGEHIRPTGGAVIRGGPEFRAGGGVMVGERCIFTSSDPTVATGVTVPFIGVDSTTYHYTSVIALRQGSTVITAEYNRLRSEAFTFQVIDLPHTIFLTGDLCDGRWVPYVKADTIAGNPVAIHGFSLHSSNDAVISVRKDRLIADVRRPGIAIMTARFNGLVSNQVTVEVPDWTTRQTAP